jgi:hypothetical protein
LYLILILDWVYIHLYIYNPAVPNREDLPDSDSDSSSDAEWTVEHFAHCEINQYVW